jgi:hypothetical protein
MSTTTYPHSLNFFLFALPQFFPLRTPSIFSSLQVAHRPPFSSRASANACPDFPHAHLQMLAQIFLMRICKCLPDFPHAHLQMLAQIFLKRACKCLPRFS